MVKVTYLKSIQGYAAGECVMVDESQVPGLVKAKLVTVVDDSVSVEKVTADINFEEEYKKQQEQRERLVRDMDDESLESRTKTRKYVKK